VNTSTPPPTDFLNLETELSEEERSLRDAVRRFVKERVVDDVSSWFDAAAFPRDLIPELGSLGLLGMHLDGYGCAGTNATSYGLACMELEAGDSGLRSFVSVQGSLAMFAIHKYGSAEQKEHWLPRMAAGQAVGCFGLTEAGSGSDPSSMKTRAQRNGTDWILNGTKMWITNGTISDIAVVWAQTDEGIRGFLVPTDAPGFEAHAIERKLSLRVSSTAELVLRDLRLSNDAVLPGVRGIGGPLSCLNEARFGIVWGAVGAARACYESALTYGLDREQFGKPIAGFQLIQQKLVEMLVSVTTSALIALRLGRLKDNGQLASQQVSLGKLHNVRAALNVARQARSVLAANGITLDFPVMRHMNNLESVLTYEGTSEIHTLILGEAITGIPSYR
jgi:glutaryl-CoA dehydrogenase